MFICDACCKVTQPGEPQRLTVAEVRPKVYTNRDGEMIGRGHEIVREEKRCGACSGTTK